MNFDTMLLSTDTSRVQSGGRSMFDKATDALTAGVAGAVVSGLSSIYNTGVYASNSVFGTTADSIDTGNVLGKVDANWRTYYEEHKGVIDTVGFIGGSFIPGGLAVKGLNLARTGESLGAFRTALGYTTKMQNTYLERGLADIAQSGTDVFRSINANKVKSMLWGAADNVLQTAVFETAAAVAMKQSPTLTNESWTDIGWDIAKGALVGGALGGGIEALWTNKIFRDAGKLVDSKIRPYDSLVAADKLNMGFGDKAFAVLDGIYDLPPAVLAADRSVQFKYNINGKNQDIPLDIGGLLDSKLRKTTETAWLKFEQKITDVLASDTTVGRPLAIAFTKMVQEGKTLGKTDTQIRETVGEYLWNLHSVQSLGGASTDFSKDVFYLVPGASLRGAKAEGAMQLFSPVRGTSSDLGYRVIGDQAMTKAGILGAGAPATIKEAWEQGFDIVFSSTQGTVKVNPNSKIYRPLADNRDDFLRTTFNVHTNQVSDSPIVTIADMATGAAPIPTISGVQSGKYTFAFNTGNFEPTLDSIQNSARHLWATQLKVIGNTTVDARDFSVLDRMAQMGLDSLVGAKIQIKQLDGTLIPLEDVAGGFSNWLVKQKTDVARGLLEAGEGVVDVRQVAYAVNSEHAWIEKAVAAEFDVAKLESKGSSRTLESYSQRDHVVMVYKKPPIADAETPDFPTGYTGYQYRKQLALQQSETASAAVLGKYGDRFYDIPTNQQLRFDGTGTGPTAAGFSNADYADPARRIFENIGSAVHRTQQDRRNEALDPLLHHFNKFVTRNDKDLSAVLTAVRRSENRLTLHNGNLVDLASLEKYEKMQEAVLKGKMRAQDVESFQFTVNRPLSPDMYSFLTDYHKGHVTWLSHQRVLAAAQGRTLDYSERALYLPPIDTKQFPYFALVKAREGRIFSGSETAMITAKNPEELQRLVSQVELDHPDLKVLLKRDTEEWFKAKGDYEFQSGFNSPAIDSMLRKTGKAGDFIPTMDAKAVTEDFVKFIGRREDNLVRSAVDVKYGQTFEELKWLSDQNTKLETSKFGFFGKQEVKKISDPFGDYRRLALNISKRSEYTLWSDVNEFVDALGKRGYEAVDEAFKQARLGKTDWIEANKSLEAMGLQGVFNSQEQYLMKQAGHDRSLVKMAVSKGNMLLANVTLRLEAANALINTISSPIALGMEVSALRNSFKKDPELMKLFDSQLHLTLPDGSGQIPSTVKLIYNAVSNFWGKDKRALIQRYEQTVGTIRNDVSQFHDMLADVAMVPNMVPSKWAERIDKGMEFGAKWTGNTGAEQFTRFIASDVMRQITQPVVDAGKMSIKEQNSFISIFVNRTQGNYISSQRPIMFQGVIGSAISLFQTYQFNMFQQLFRHIENRDLKTIAVGAALQSTFFGMNGLPMFDAINTHIIGNANINEGHHDVYSKVASLDKDIGDFALYGALSAFPAFSDKAPALYTRGDLNPRHITIVPTSFSELPIVEGFSRVAKAAWGIGNQVANGGSLGNAMLHGLEHNGINRPLAGLAQTIQGRSTTNQGSIISANNDWLSITSATRMLGAKPMDESVAMNHKFRMVAYQAADKERIEKLGVVIKQRIVDGSLSEEDVLDFAGRYAAVGGRVQNYGAAMQRWVKSATQSQVNTIMRAHNTTQGQRLFEVMGGDPLPDLTNNASQAGEADK